MDAILLWIEAHPAFAYWVQGGAIFMTGVVALIAASRAYKGAKEQSQAIREQIRATEAQYENERNHNLKIRQEEKSAEIKTAAIALASEISNQIINLTNLYRKAGGSYVSYTWISWIRGKDHIFKHNPYIISKFSPTVADNIVKFYSLIETELTHFDNFSPPNPTGGVLPPEKKSFENQDAIMLAGRLRFAIETGRRAVDALSEIADRKESMLELNKYVEAAFTKVKEMQPNDPTTDKNTEKDRFEVPQQEKYYPGKWLDNS